MRAMAMDSYGGSEVLTLREMPDPLPAPGLALIRVRAAAVNPADGKWRVGMFRDMVPMRFPAILGYDIAGTVVGGDGPATGTRVVAMLDPIAKGGYAELVAVASDTLVEIPASLDYATAAAIPTAGLSGLQMVERAAGVKPGQRVIVTGALGSVGRCAAFYARKAGATVIAAVRASQIDAALADGATKAVELGTHWSGRPADALIDTVGGAAVAYLALNLVPGAPIVTASTNPIPPDGLSSQPAFFAVTPSRADLERLVRDVASHELTMPVAVKLPLIEAARAQDLVAAGGLRGKVVLEL